MLSLGDIQPAARTADTSSGIYPPPGKDTGRRGGSTLAPSSTVPWTLPIVHRASARRRWPVEVVSDVSGDLWAWFAGAPATVELRVALVVVFVAAMVFAGVLAALRPLP